MDRKRAESPAATQPQATQPCRHLGNLVNFSLQTQTTCPQLSRFFMNEIHGRIIEMSLNTNNQVQLSDQVKRSHCNACGSIWTPTNCRARIISTKHQSLSKSKDRVVAISLNEDTLSSGVSAKRQPKNMVEYTCLVCNTKNRFRGTLSDFQIPSTGNSTAATPTANTVTTSKPAQTSKPKNVETAGQSNKERQLPPAITKAAKKQKKKPDIKSMLMASKQKQKDKEERNKGFGLMDFLADL